MARKALTLGSAVIDIIVTIDPDRIEQMQMRNADTSFLLVEEGRKVDAESITRHIGGGGVNTAVALARLGFDTATLVKTGDDRNREDVTTRLAEEGVRLDHVLKDSALATGSSVLIFTMRPSTGGVRVLIVDGHPLFCAGLVQLLDQAAGIGAVKAATGLREGVRLAERFEPDVVLIDPSLPDAGPFEVARQVRSHCPSSRFLFLDGVVREIHVRAALEAGAAGYWTKYASLDQIVQAISRVAGGESAFCRKAEAYLASTRRGLRFRPSGKSTALERLSSRELEVLLNLARGLSVRQCADRMQLSPSTIGNHKARLMKKLNLHKAVDLVLLAFREGLVD